MTVPSAKEVRALGDSLCRDPLQHANNAATLLACLQEPLQEPVARAAIQALKLFYIAQHDEGSIGGASGSSKRQKLDTSPAAAAAADEEQGPEAAAREQYVLWLGRQYAAFTAQLLRLLRGCASPSLQVAAVAALMECVRHEAGPAAFSNRLFGRLLRTLVLGPVTQPEAVALLASKYLACWDVRFHTLRTLSRLAQQRAVRGGGGSAGAGDAAGGSDDDDGEEDDEAGPAAGGSEAGQQQLLPKAAADVARAMFDVLAQVQPVVAQQQPPRQQGGQQQRQRGQGEEDEEEQAPVQSWCGASEAGLVTAASAAASLSAKARRKRKQQQQQAAAAAAAPKQAAAAVAWANKRLQQRAYQEAWLALLRTDLPSDIYKKVLLKLHAEVLPAMTSPLLLADFLTHALDAGGFEGMLALNGIFTLVTQHGLEYPAFYTRLYGLLTPSAFTSKHRAKFFQLADIFLASGMVPAYTAAAFAKRMARLALTAPPAGAMLALAFIHNTIRRHPACMVLLHKPQQQAAAAAGGGAGAGAAEGAGVDVYDAAEPDPAKSRAVESSLWEVAALRNHYSPQVAAMCAVLDKDLSDRVRTSEVDVAPLLAASYSSLLQQELGRKLRKGVAVAFYATPPAGLFDAAELADDLPGWDLAVGPGEA